MKKYIFTLTFILLGMSINAQSVWNGKREAIRKGSGTESNPYLIENAQNFAWLCYLINHDYTEWADGKYFLLTTDIDLNGNEDNQWIPILAGNHHKGALNINLDGDRHKISGLYIDNNSVIKDKESIWNAASAALFVDLGSESSVKNLYVEGNISVDDKTCAGLAGKDLGVIENSVTNVDIETNHIAAGFVGETGGGIIENCQNMGDIKGGDFVGGIFGGMGGATIENCYNVGNIEGNECVGGIAGFIMGSGAIKNAYNVGNVNGESYVGAIIGRKAASIAINNTHYLNTCLEENNEFGTSQTADFMRSQEFVAVLNNETDVWCFDEEITNDGYPILSTNIGLSVEQLPVDNNVVTIYPNPAGEYFTISGEITSYAIYNILGNIIYNDETVCDNIIKVSVSDYTSGIYFVRCATQDGNVITKKIIVK